MDVKQKFTIKLDELFAHRPEPREADAYFMDLSFAIHKFVADSRKATGTENDDLSAKWLSAHQGLYELIETHKLKLGNHLDLAYNLHLYIRSKAVKSESTSQSSKKQRTAY